MSQVDGHWFDNAFDPSRAVGELCGDADDVHGGTLEGVFLAGNDGSRTTFEFQIPLNSGDALDISVAAGSFIDMVPVMQIWDSATGTSSEIGAFPISGLLRILIF